MNSSTSSSKNEWKVLLVVGLALVACEIGTRVLARGFADVQRREEIPLLARGLADKPAPRIVFLGNSLTREGIDVAAFKGQLAQHGLQTGGIAKICADDTSLRQWSYIFERTFTGGAAVTKPDVVIVTFIEDHLSDQTEARWIRTALNVEGPEQVWDVLTHDVTSVDEGACFLTAHYLDAVAYQPEVKGGILRRIVPNYRRQTQRMNYNRRAYLERQTETKLPTAKPRYTYKQLQDFLSALSGNDIQAVICFMPEPLDQFLDPLLVQTVEQSKMTFLDLRDLINQTRGHYPDGLHLDEVGANIYSRALADLLAEKLPGEFAAASN